MLWLSHFLRYYNSSSILKTPNLGKVAIFQELFQGKAKGFDMEKALLAKSIRDFEKAISMVSQHKRRGRECEQVKKIYKTQCFMLNKYMMYSYI